MRRVSSAICTSAEPGVLRVPAVGGDDLVLLFRGQCHLTGSFRSRASSEYQGRDRRLAGEAHHDRLPPPPACRARPRRGRGPSPRRSPRPGSTWALPPRGPGAARPPCASPAPARSISWSAPRASHAPRRGRRRDRPADAGAADDPLPPWRTGSIACTVVGPAREHRLRSRTSASLCLPKRKL